MTSRWVLPLGFAGSTEWDVVVDDRVDGWSHTGLYVGRLGAGDRRTLDTGPREVVVVPLSGSVRVVCTDDAGTTHTADLAGRPSVFAGPTDVAYAPRGSRLVLEADADCRVALAVAALPEAAPSECPAFRHLPAADVPTELRGAGQSSREVRSFGTPGVLDAERLIACEEIDVLAEVRTGDVVLVPFGWHGPAMAVPGYDLYYLNVMAGPVHDGAERAWLICDDPAHGWVRETWATQDVDPRLPLGGTP